MERFVLWGKYCENAIEKRAPFREVALEVLGLREQVGRRLLREAARQPAKARQLLQQRDQRRADSRVELRLLTLV